MDKVVVTVPRLQNTCNFHSIHPKLSINCDERGTMQKNYSFEAIWSVCYSVTAGVHNSRELFPYISLFLYCVHKVKVDCTIRSMIDFLYQEIKYYNMQVYEVPMFPSSFLILTKVVIRADKKNELLIQIWRTVYQQLLKILTQICYYTNSFIW